MTLNLAGESLAVPAARERIDVYKNRYFCVLTKDFMRTNIDMDDKLLQDAMELSKAKTKKEVVEQALSNYVKMMNRKQILDWPGKVHWDGDLDRMRTQE